ncbi:MAG: LamG domain-containing protein [Planctomycetes bacterium]|nr:LamG domain-containing protein [Planctomycetota bacterium]
MRTRALACRCALAACMVLGVAGGLAAAPGTSPDEGLVSYWSFQGTTEDVAAEYDNSSGGADDNLTGQGGDPLYIKGLVGQALAIGTGVGDPAWLNAPDSEDVELGAIYTIEAWVYPTALDEGWQRLVLRWEAGAMYYHFALKLVGTQWTVSLYHQQESGTQVNIDAGVVVLNQWQHVAAVADGDFLRVYLDGAEVGSVPYDGTINQAAGGGLGIGDMAPGNGLRYNGYIDELAIWNIPLTADEILSHFEAGGDGYGLTRIGCDEIADGVAISGPTNGTVGVAEELVADAAGIDAGSTATFDWQIIAGTATIQGQGTDTVQVTASEAGDVTIRVTLKDGNCDGEWDAQAEHTITVLGGMPGESPATGLVSYWSFDDDSTDDEADLFENNSGLAFDALAPQGGTARYVSGMRGQALAIGIEAGDPLWLNAPESEDADLGPIYTIETWVYPTLLDEDWQRLVLRWQAVYHYHFALKSVGGVWTVSLYHQQESGAQVNVDAGVVTANRWQHVAGVADGESLRVYLNGEEVGNVPYDGTINPNAGTGLGIGDMPGGNGLRYNGYLDELAMWEVALTADEIQSHFLAGPGGYGLVRGCMEIRDVLAVSGPSAAKPGQAVTLTAEFEGIDPAATATYAWELVEGAATLGPTNERTLTVTPTATGFIEVRVAAGDGVCDDTATAGHTVTVFPGGTGTSPDEGLVAYWSFDETTGDLAEEQPNGTGAVADDLTAQGGDARYTAGVVGQAIAIGVEGGDAPWLDAPDSEDIEVGPIYTIEAWIWPTELADSWQRIALHWGGTLDLHSFHFSIRNNGVNAQGQPCVNAVSLFHGQANDVEPNANGGTILLSRWQHIAGVADGEFLRVYLDGEEVDAVPYDGTVHEATGEGLGIGDSATALSTIRYNGLLDELALWNVPLTEDEIRSHAEAGPDGYGFGGGPTGPFFIRGDTDGNGSYTIGDGVQILERLFTNRTAFTSDCEETGDVDGNGTFTIGDAVWLFNFLFTEGADPAPPANTCGTAPIKIGCNKDTCGPAK